MTARVELIQICEERGIPHPDIERLLTILDSPKLGSAILKYLTAAHDVGPASITEQFTTTQYELWKKLYQSPDFVRHEDLYRSASRWYNGDVPRETMMHRLRETVGLMRRILDNQVEYRIIGSATRGYKLTRKNGK